MDAQTLRRALADFFKFDPKYFFVKGSGTGFLVSLVPLRASASTAEKCPFDFTVNSVAGTIQLHPGAVNQLMPSNMLDAHTLGTGVNYVKLDCDTNGKQVNAVEIVVDSTPSAPPVATMGAAPPNFKVLLGVVVESAGVYTPFKSWGCGSVNAIPIELIRTDKASPIPGNALYDTWYSWSVGVSA